MTSTPEQLRKQAARDRAKARSLLNEGERTVYAISRLADERQSWIDLPATPARVKRVEDFTRQMDELGKKAMGIWAQSTAYATLGNVPIPPDPRDMVGVL